MASMSNGENGGINNVSAWRNVIAKIININNGVIINENINEMK
jgi:hypothetical protein